MKDLAFPWNPNGYIPPSCEHLFRPPKKKGEQPWRNPSTYRTPTAAGNFTIGKPEDVAERKKRYLASI